MDNNSTEVKVSENEKKSFKKEREKNISSTTVKKKSKKKKNRAKAAKRVKNMRNMSVYMLGTVIKVVVYIAFVIFVYFACTKAYNFSTTIFTEKGMVEEGSAADVEVVVTIPAGASVKEVAGILKENGVIADELAFLIQSYLYEANFKSGTYTLRTSYEPEVIVDALSDRL